MRQFRTDRLGRKILSGWLLAAGFALWLGPALHSQDFSGANQSDDPCYKIKQMKKAILESPAYKKMAGSKAPDYIQCHPLTINLTWKLTESIVHDFGKDWITLDLEEEYPAYLMLHYGWFDKLQKKELQQFEILGPEPCWAPCPGRAKAQLNLEGEAVICQDYYQNCKPTVLNIESQLYEVYPADEEGQNTSFRVQWEGGRTSGRIWSSAMAARKETKPKGRGVQPVIGSFWDKHQYQVELNGTGVNTSHLHRLSLKSDWTPEEIFEGLRTGTLTKVLAVQATQPAAFPHDPVYSLQGTVTAKVFFGPVKEERWRITVKGQEKDNLKGDFVYKDQKGQAWKIPLCAYFDLNLVGEFVIRKVKDDWTYKEGRVTKADSAISFTDLPPDLYYCTVKECAGQEGIPSMVGNFLQGTLQSKKIQLTWAEATKPRTSACVFCKPKKSFLSKIPYKQEFGSPEFIFRLNSETLPLQNGLTVNRKVGDFLTYTITLTKIQ